MNNSDVATAINRFYANECTKDDVELILRSYEPLFSFYTSILLGRQINTGKPVISDVGVRSFIIHLHQGTNVEKTLGWIINACKRFNESELRASVIEAFFRSITIHSRVENFAKYLAENIIELIGNQNTTMFSDMVAVDSTLDYEETIVDPTCDVCELAYTAVMNGYTETEKRLHELDIVPTQRELEVIRVLSFNYDVGMASKVLNISEQRIYEIINNIKRKIVKH